MGNVERLVAEGDDGTGDDEFLQYLTRGGELLSGGQVAEAKEELEKAFRLQPKNAKAQNLLGLAYFKLGTFDRAAEIYELLVRDNPVDPTLRVNLGLVYLKHNALQRAIRELETAVDLAPDHKKAQNYLGLAFAQAGEHARAKDCFVAAGSLTMAERMEKALKDPSAAGPVPFTLSEGREVGVLSGNGVDPQAQHSEIEVEIEVDAIPEQAGHAAASIAPPPTAPSGTARPAVRAPSPPPPGAGAAVATLSELARASVLPTWSTQEPFEVSGDAVLVRVHGEMLSRLSGLLAAHGALQYLAEMKRFRGKATDKAFGEGERRMVRISGNGTLYLNRGDRHFVPVELWDEPAYFNEELLFAFQESLVFENGRVPSKIAPDLHLVHLRGRGRALLCLPGPLRSLQVAGGVPMVVPIVALVGWHGNLTPKIVGLPEEQDSLAAIPSVALVGEGWALVSPPP